MLIYESHNESVDLICRSSRCITFADDVQIEYVAQANPKRKGSKAWARYNRYKSARTKREMFDLGGTKGDFKWDLNKGYVRVLS